jgi:hypothetical protein
MDPKDKGFPLSRGLAPFGLLFVVAAAAYLALWWVDYGTWERNPLALWTGPAAYDVLSNFAEVTIAVFGVAITVVAILVELAVQPVHGANGRAVRRPTASASAW